MHRRLVLAPCVLLVLLGPLRPLAADPAGEASSSLASTLDAALEWVLTAEDPSQEEIDRAAEVLSEAGEGADDARLVEGLAQLAAFRGEWKRARKLGARATELSPDDASTHIRYAKICFGSLEEAGLLSAGGIAKKARTALTRALEIDPSNAEALEFLAGYYLFAPGFAGGDKAKGDQLARRLASLDEGRVSGNLLLGTRLHMNRKYALAGERFDLAMEAAQDDPEKREQVVLARAGLDVRAERWAEAAGVLEPFVAESDAAPAGAWFLLGTAQRGLGRTEDAIASLERVLEIEPQAERSPVLLGECLESVERYEPAIEAYEHYLEYHPDGSDARKARKAIRRAKKKLRSKRR